MQHFSNSPTQIQYRWEYTTEVLVFHTGNGFPPFTFCTFQPHEIDDPHLRAGGLFLNYEWVVEREVEGRCGRTRRGRRKGRRWRWKGRRDRGGEPGGSGKDASCGQVRFVQWWIGRRGWGRRGKATPFYCTSWYRH